MKTLLTIGNPKTSKGEHLGYMTAVLHLAPAGLAGGTTMCPASTPECEAACLNKAGRGGIGLDADGLNTIQRARIARTHWYLRDPEGFAEALIAEALIAGRKARRLGLKLALRLNGTSDRNFMRLYGRIRQAFADAGLDAPDTYDYTKVAGYINIAPSWHSLTLSRSGHNDGACLATLAQGGNVSVVFSTRKGGPLPSSWQGFPVIDGDTHDLRFLDPRGVVVGLRAKGPAKKMPAGGFIVAA